MWMEDQDVADSGVRGEEDDDGDAADDDDNVVDDDDATRRNQMPRGARHLGVRKRANPQHNLPPLEVSGYLP